MRREREGGKESGRKGETESTNVYCVDLMSHCEKVDGHGKTV